MQRGRFSEHASFFFFGGGGGGFLSLEEYFEYTPGVLRAFVKPAHLDSLTFTLQPVYERKMGVKFIWGEVKDARHRTVRFGFWCLSGNGLEGLEGRMRLGESVFGVRFVRFSGTPGR